MHVHIHEYGVLYIFYLTFDAQTVKLLKVFYITLFQLV